MKHICIIVATFTVRISYPVASHTYISDICFPVVFMLPDYVSA